MNARAENRSDEGWALVSVLWVVSILAMLAAATQMLTVTSYRGEAHAADRAKIGAALDGALTRAVVGISDARIEQRWRVDGTPQFFSFAGYTMRVSVQDELGRFDINLVDDTVLRQLLRQVGVNEATSEVLSDRILDWRTKSDSSLSRLHGATDADYAAAGLPWHPRHGPLQSVSELQLVLGMTPALYARLRPVLTVYTHNPSIDPQVAPREALLALFLGDTAKVDALMRLRNAPLSDELNQSPSTRPGFLNPQMPLVGLPLAIHVDTYVGRAHYQRETVIELTGDDNRPYLVLSWQ